MTEQFVMHEHTIVIERVLDAPRELVWKMWTDPDEVTKWWGPEHFTTPRDKIEFDLRRGGVCRLTMVGPTARSTRATVTSESSSRPRACRSERRPPTTR